ncbi:MAG: anaerobic sulfite reductase subunit AsrB [Symbiobacteriaceae bacterium]|nr:anaerobic sulfite reductase subunit AsrB [Symbiobacteriaceae bacterium]
MSRNLVEPVPCTVLRISKENANEVTFRVASDIKPIHGQFLQLSLPKIGEAPISVSAFAPGWLEFTIRGVGRVTDRLFSLTPGDQLFLRGAYGNGWPLEVLREKHLVVITGGTGLAPVRSLLQEAAGDSSLFKTVTLISGFRNSDSILFGSELEAWRKPFNVFYTLDNQEIPGFARGMVTAHLDKIPLSGIIEGYNLLIIGPPAMMHYTALGCLELGIPEENIWLSFERRMSCAVGKCGHCRIDEKYVCLDGPVFNYRVARNMID